MYIATMMPRIAAMMTVRTIHRNSTTMITKRIVVTIMRRSSGSVSSASVGDVRRSTRRRSAATGIGSAISPARGLTGVVNAADLRALVAPVRHAHRVLVLPRHADVERLEAALEQPRRERIGRLAPQHHLAPHFVAVRRRAADHAGENVVVAVEV